MLAAQTPNPARSIREAEDILATAARSGIEGLGVACKRGWILRRLGHVIADHLELSIAAARGLKDASGNPAGVSLGTIEIGPRHGKTIRSCVLAAARALGLDPHLQIVTGSHSRDLAARNILDTKSIMQHPRYLEAYRTRLRSTVENANGQMRTHAQDRAQMFRTLYKTLRGEIAAGDGYYLSTSLAAGLTGWGFNLGICDDLISNRDDCTEGNLAKVWEWYQSVFETRQAPGRSAIILMGTRWHPDDHIGRALRDWEKRGLPHFRCRLPSLMDEDTPEFVPTYPGAQPYEWRGPGEWLIPEEEWVGFYERTASGENSELWDAMYQQRPITPGGTIFKEADFGQYDPAALPEFETVFVSCDPASKKTGKSRSAIAVWGVAAGRLYRLAESTDRWDYADLEREFLGVIGKDGAVSEAAGPWPEAESYLIEDTSNGVALLSRLGHLPGIVRVKPPGSSKETRANMCLRFVRQGRVLLPSRSYGRISDSWVKEYKAEMARFPATPNDRADETTQAIQWASEAGFFRVVA